MKTNAKITVDELGGISYIINGLEVCGLIENGKFVQYNHNSIEAEKYFSERQEEISNEIINQLNK